MPVKIWARDNGALSSRVATSRTDSYQGERYRSNAEALDRAIDQMLDAAVRLSMSAEAAEAAEQVFVRRWAIGRALAESRLLESEHLAPQEEESLWLAIARKCRLGIRANGDPEDSWRGLIPNRKAEPNRIGRDVFAVSLWLQEQAVDSAKMAFGGRFWNAQQLHGRETLRSLGLREALAKWMASQSPAIRSQLSNRALFTGLAKALAARFPARGPGSAKRPVHYSDKALYEETRQVLDRAAAELAGDGGAKPLTRP